MHHILHVLLNYFVLGLWIWLIVGIIRWLLGISRL